MACSSSSVRPWQRSKPRIEWMWQRNDHPIDLSQEAEWTAYSDVEILIIEEAYQKKEPQALLHQYHINFEHLTQISNNDEKEQRPVKRIALDSPQQRLRKERFLAHPPAPCKSFSDSFDDPLLDEIRKHFRFWYDRKGTEYEIPLFVEKTAEGLIIEGKLLDKEWEAKQMADQLLRFKDSPLEEIARMCAHLYSLDSFLYRKLNEIMRLQHEESYKDMLKSKAFTFGRFACLLYSLKQTEKERDTPVTVYRGCNLTTEAIEEWKQLCEQHRTCDHMDRQFCSFSSFTSTSRSRKMAEFLAGNVLFIIKICAFHDGRDISPHSQFEEEEEILLLPSVTYHVNSCVYDETIKKWIIHLISDFYDQ
jgi:hypothetical protein